MTPEIPTPDSITAEFLTEQLREAGHAGVEVRGFTGERIGTGQIGQCIRYQLDLAGGDGSAPRQLVGKFPSDDPQSRQTGVQFRNFLKEVCFYRELQPRLAIRTPRCYFAAIEGEGPEFMLLLEDLAPAVQGDQLGGCSPAVARAAVLELVGLHAPSCLPFSSAIAPASQRTRRASSSGSPTRTGRHSSPWATSSVWYTWTTGWTT